MKKHLVLSMVGEELSIAGELEQFAKEIREGKFDTNGIGHVYSPDLVDFDYDFFPTEIKWPHWTLGEMLSRNSYYCHY